MAAQSTPIVPATDLDHAVDSVDPAREAKWRARAVQLQETFVTELVEAHDFCPWAQSARIAGRTKIVALWQHELDRFLRTDLHDESHAKMEVWQLVLLDVRMRAMDWRATVAEMEQRLRRDDVPLPWAFAAFHPTHPGRPQSVGGVIGMLRRSPLPTIQLVRLDVLDRVRARAPEQSEGLAEHNRAHMDQWLKQPEQVAAHARWLAAAHALTAEIDATVS